MLTSACCSLASIASLASCLAFCTSFWREFWASMMRDLNSISCSFCRTIFSNSFIFCWSWARFTFTVSSFSPRSLISSL